MAPRLYALEVLYSQLAGDIYTFVSVDDIMRKDHYIKLEKNIRQSTENLAFGDSTGPSSKTILQNISQIGQEMVPEQLFGVTQPQSGPKPNREIKARVMTIKISNLKDLKNFTKQESSKISLQTCKAKYKNI